MAIQNPFEGNMLARVDRRLRNERRRAEVQAILDGPTVATTPSTAGRRFLVVGRKLEPIETRPEVIVDRPMTPTPRAMFATRVTADDLLREIREKQGLIAASSRASGSSSRGIVRRAHK